MKTCPAASKPTLWLIINALYECIVYFCTANLSHVLWFLWVRNSDRVQQREFSFALWCLKLQTKYKTPSHTFSGCSWLSPEGFDGNLNQTVHLECLVHSLVAGSQQQVSQGRARQNAYCLLWPRLASQIASHPHFFSQGSHNVQSEGTDTLSLKWNVKNKQHGIYIGVAIFRK